MRWLALTFAFLTAGTHLLAQSEESSNDKDESVSEALLDDAAGDDNLETHGEELQEEFTDPIDLNKASVEQLRQLYMLDEGTIQGLVHYREQHGKLLSLYELQVVPGFTPELIRRIKPFVTVEELTPHRLPRSRTVRHGNHSYFLMRYSRILESKEGFHSPEPGSRFLGVRGQRYFRFQSSRSGSYHVGFTLENDAGESWRWKPNQRQYGFDYLSFHAQLENRGPITNLIVGDFSTQFGQGLILGRNFGLGKGAETVTAVRRTNLGFLPYTSSGENGYLRGGALTISPVANLYVSGFYSSTHRDAYTSILDDQETVSSFIDTGLHRNTSEISRRMAEGRQDWGAILQFRRSTLDLGLLFATTTFSKPVVPGERDYNQFAFKGKSDPLGGAYFNFNAGSVAFFSEVAANKDGGYGGILGLTGSFGPSFDATVTFRKYGRSFHSWSQSAFGEASSPVNEEGFYFGWKEQLNRRLSLSGYADLFESAWLRFNTYGPSSGHEEFLRLTFDSGGSAVVYAQIKREVKQANSSIDENLYLLTTTIKRSGRIDFNYSATPKLGMRSRIQDSEYRTAGSTSHGITLLQDFNLHLHRFKVSVRYAVFDTDSYDSRLYIYERDAWLAFSLPAYYGRGIRTYALFELDAARWLTLWVRFSHTRYSDDTTFGSGLDKIPGSVKNDLKLQVRITPN